MTSSAEREPARGNSVDVFIVNFAGADVLKRCVESILAATGVDASLTIINNDPDDPSVGLTVENHPNIKVITPQKNVGYAGAIHIAAENTSTDHLVICNNDLLFEPDAISRMIACARDKNADCVSARIVNPDESPTEADFNASLNPYFFLVYGVFEDRSVAVYPSGACFLVKSKALAESLPPEDFFLYYEDVFLGMTLRMNGYSIVQASDALVKHHHGHAAGGMDRGKLTFYRERNRQACLRSFFSGTTLLKLSLAWPLLAINRAFTAPGRGASVGGTLTAWLHAACSPFYIRKLREKLGVKPGMGEKICSEYFTSRLVSDDHPRAKSINGFSAKMFKFLGIKTRD